MGAVTDTLNDSNESNSKPLLVVPDLVECNSGETPTTGESQVFCKRRQPPRSKFPTTRAMYSSWEQVCKRVSSRRRMRLRTREPLPRLVRWVRYGRRVRLPVRNSCARVVSPRKRPLQRRRNGPPLRDGGPSRGTFSFGRSEFPARVALPCLEPSELRTSPARSLHAVLL